jgi:hypothetical protein
MTRIARTAPSTLFVLLLCLSISGPRQARCQEGVLTVDYFGYPRPWYPFSLEINPGFSKALAPDSWREYYLTATLSWQPTDWFRADGAGEAHVTVDPGLVNSTELRPTLLGALIWPTQGRYLNLYNPEFNTRFDCRFISYDGKVEDEVKTRFRFQLNGKFTINDTTMSIGTWYVPWAVEAYKDLDGDPKERYAYMWRWRLGIGYVVSGFMRAEAHYIASRSRNTISDPFELASRTVWLVVRNYY